MISSSLKDLRVLITGAGSGIGLEVAKQFAASGARVHICDIVQRHVDELPQNISGMLADVSDPAAVERLFEDVGNRFGGLDVLINNAGVTGPMAAVEIITADEIERTFKINIFSMFHCTRYAVPMLKAARGGLIINMSSVAGRMGFAFRSPYSASKFAVTGLTESLAVELGPHNIRVNAILPGIVSGERHDRNLAARASVLGITPEELYQQRMKHISIGRPVRPEEIAQTALFLASEGGRGISGQSLSVCGDLNAIV
jgi:NAD(P)-dependent dehydrogenase (short-subunit alcohol dehydrogenase family)